MRKLKAVPPKKGPKGTDKVLTETLGKASKSERHPYVGDGGEQCLGCRKPEDHPDHYSEAECALVMVKLGFKIVGKNSDKPVTIEELEAVIKKEREHAVRR